LRRLAELASTVLGKLQVPSTNDLRVIALAAYGSHTPVMLKRAIIGMFWTYAAYGVWKIGADVLGLPQHLDLVAMVASAMLGAVMGLHPIRSAPWPKRRVARIPDRVIPGDGISVPRPES
jgi:hypothetical protein